MIMRKTTPDSYEDMLRDHFRICKKQPRSGPGFRGRSRPEPVYLTTAGGGAVTLARLRLQPKF